jgi:flagellar basal-body rod protein FlgF
LIKGLYTAASGMMLQLARQDVVANNIANVNTAGFKKDTTTCRAFPDMLISRLGEVTSNPDATRSSLPPVVIGGLGTGAVVDRIITDFSQGNTKKTDNPLDLALNGEGYFVVQTPQGERFTRDGSFKLNEEGLLTTNQGYPVLDQDDNQIWADSDFTVNSQGDILVDGEVIARLKIVTFIDPQMLQKEGDNLRSQGQYEWAANPQVMQGYLEESNVNAVKEMINLITVTRAYESLQKVVQAEDETIAAAIDQAGSVR